MDHPIVDCVTMRYEAGGKSKWNDGHWAGSGVWIMAKDASIARGNDTLMAEYYANECAKRYRETLNL